MRPIIKIVLILVILTSVVPAQAQSNDCNKEDLRNWLRIRRSNMNATLDVIHGIENNQYDIVKGVILMHEHELTIFATPRPACTDEALFWTLFLYTATNEMLLCSAKEINCVNIGMERLNIYKQANTLFVVPLYEQAGLSLKSYRDIRPNGWSVFWHKQLIHSETNDSIQM